MSDRDQQPATESGQAQPQGELAITWLHDGHECETCGPSYALGAVVTLNGETLLELQPSAHCYDGSSWDHTDIYRMILEKLGYKVEETTEEEDEED